MVVHPINISPPNTPAIHRLVQPAKSIQDNKWAHSLAAQSSCVVSILYFILPRSPCSQRQANEKWFATNLAITHNSVTVSQLMCTSSQRVVVSATKLSLPLWLAPLLHDARHPHQRNEEMRPERQSEKKE